MAGSPGVPAVAVNVRVSVPFISRVSSIPFAGGLQYSRVHAGGPPSSIVTFGSRLPSTAALRTRTSVAAVTLSDAPTEQEGGKGHGLVGMRERVGLFGGELQAGPGHSGGYSVRARFPVEPGR